ncbi:hypothetical protein ABPG77_010200 [Micractinium sp. CCAP 211/92]
MPQPWRARVAQQMAVLEGRPLTPSHFPNDPSLWDETLDLTPYINTSAARVPESYTLERAYLLFSTMGLRPPDGSGRAQPRAGHGDAQRPAGIPAG